MKIATQNLIVHPKWVPGKEGEGGDEPMKDINYL